MEKHSTGSCVSIEEVPSGNEIGILWAPVREGALVGFALDMDKAGTFQTALEEVRMFCIRHKLGVSSALEEAREGECVLERMHADAFLDRFGGLPVGSGIFFDEGGSIGTASETFGTDQTDDLTENANNEHAQMAMHEAARKAALETAGVIAAVVVAYGAFLALAPALALTFAVVALALVGVWHICRSVKKMTQSFYKKAVMPSLDACRFVAEKKTAGEAESEAE